MTTPQTTPDPTGMSSTRGASRWSQLIALVLVALLLVVLPLTLWRHWENAAVPSAALTSNVRTSKKVQTGRVKNNAASTNAQTGADQPGSSVAQFIYANSEGVELARMVPVSLQGDANGNEADGQRSVLITVAIRNTGDQDLQLSPELFSLTDASGAAYPVSTTNQPVKTGGGKSKPQNSAATPAAAERTRDREPKPDKTERAQDAGKGSGSSRREATPGASEAKSRSGAGKQAANRKQDAANESVPTAATLERQVLPPGGELRAELPFTLPASERPGQLMFTPEPDRVLIVADLNALLGGQSAE